MKQVVCTGLAVLDHVFQLPTIPKTPVKSFASNYIQVGGGSAATAAVALNRAGGQAVYWGRHGDDHNGNLILAELEEFGVDVLDVLRMPGVKSGVSSVLIDSSGERLITNYSDPQLIGNANWLPLERLKESSAVLTDLRWHEGAIKTLNRARQLGIPAVLDADLAPENLNEEIIRNANSLTGKVKVIFLENYNMRLGRLITSGVDVWLNTPLRPNEASGTSGMKAALNGIPNLSILDGWWAEGCDHKNNGWAISSPDSCNDEEDAESLYQILENEVIPTFYNEKQKWTQIMRASIKTGVQFTAHQMISEYQKNMYKDKAHPVLQNS